MVVLEFLEIPVTVTGVPPAVTVKSLALEVMDPKASL